jgi:hypothetical protein
VYIIFPSDSAGLLKAVTNYLGYYCTLVMWKQKKTIREVLNMTSTRGHYYRTLVNM